MCASCATPAGACVECEARLSDPYQLRRSYDVVAAMTAAARLMVATLPGVAVFSLLDVGVSAALHTANSGDLRFVTTKYPLAALVIVGVLSALLKALPMQASLALIVAKAERVELTRFSAFREGLAAWPRTVWAILRWHAQVFIGSMFFFIPGIWLMVRLVYAPIIAFRVRSQDPLEFSHETLAGRFAEGAITAVLGYGTSLVVAVVTGIVNALLRTQPPTVAWSAQVASWFLVAFFTNGLLNAFFYASFMMSTHGRGHALEPMAWHTSQSRPQPSQS